MKKLSIILALTFALIGCGPCGRKPINSSYNSTNPTADTVAGISIKIETPGGYPNRFATAFNFKGHEYIIGESGSGIVHAASCGCMPYGKRDTIYVKEGASQPADVNAYGWKK